MNKIIEEAEKILLGHHVKSIKEYDTALENLIKQLKTAENNINKHNNFLQDIVNFGYVQCTAHDEGAGCYLISAVEFDKEFKALKEYGELK